MIGAIVLAAGRSTRMGVNKLVLPFGETTLIAHVVAVLIACGLDELVVVTGHAREQVEGALSHLPVRFVHNADYAEGEMFASIQTGLRAVAATCPAVLITPGDLALIEARAVAQVMDAYAPGRIVIPSNGRRGGHPILVDRAYWPAILAAPPSATLRDIIRAHLAARHYIQVESEGILRDVDTPDQYRDALTNIHQ